MTYRQIYDKFCIPPNLEEHMLRVWGVGEIILKNLRPEIKFNRDLIKPACLLHDLGNIVKFTDIKDEFWKLKQKEIIELYGSDDHEATKKMLAEISAPQELVDVILNKSFGNSVATALSDNWPLKILYYADLRVLPNGIGTLEDRINDVKARMPKYTSRPDFPDLVSACHQIENQVTSILLDPSLEISDITAAASISVLAEAFSV